MNLIRSISIILTTCILFVFQTVYAAPEMKTCERWILDDTSIPVYDSEDTELNSNRAAAYRYEYNGDPDRYNKFNFWKNAYTRYKCIEEMSSWYTWDHINPKVFCNRIGGSFVILSELITHETEMPCYLWILVSGYNAFDMNENQKTANNRKNNSLDTYLSGYAKEYAEYLRKEYEKNESSINSTTLGKSYAGKSESSINMALLDKRPEDKKLNPQEFCQEILDLDYEKKVHNKVL